MSMLIDIETCSEPEDKSHLCEEITFGTINTYSGAEALGSWGFYERRRGLQIKWLKTGNKSFCQSESFHGNHLTSRVL